MRVLSAAKGEVVALGFPPGRAALVVAHDRAGVFVWDLAAGAPPRRLTPDEYPPLGHVSFTPDGRLLGRHVEAGPVVVDLATGGREPIGPAAGGPYHNLALAPDGRRLFLFHDGPRRQTLSVWHPAAGGWERDWAADFNMLVGLAVSPAGDRVAHLRLRPGTGGGRRFDLVVRRAATGRTVDVRDCPYTYPRRPLFGFDPDGRRLVAVHEMTLLVWDLDRDGKPRAVRNDTRRHFTAAEFHPAGRHLLTTSNDATVVVWDSATWDPVARFAWDVGRLRSVAVSPDGTLAAAGSDTGRVVVWDVDL